PPTARSPARSCRKPQPPAGPACARAGGDDVEAVGIREEHIDDHGVERLRGEGLQSRRPAAGFRDLETIDPEHHRDHRAYVLLIVDHEDVGHRTASKRLPAQPTMEAPRLCKSRSLFSAYR